MRVTLIIKWRYSGRAHTHQDSAQMCCYKLKQAPLLGTLLLRPR
jgi:hypothetical protein